MILLHPLVALSCSTKGCWYLNFVMHDVQDLHRVKVCCPIRGFDDSHVNIVLPLLNGSLGCDFVQRELSWSYN